MGQCPQHSPHRAPPNSVARVQCQRFRKTATGGTIDYADNRGGQGFGRSLLQLLPGNRGSHESRHRRKNSMLELCWPSITPRILSLPAPGSTLKPWFFQRARLGEYQHHQRQDGCTGLFCLLWLCSLGAGPTVDTGSAQQPPMDGLEPKWRRPVQPPMQIPPGISTSAVLSAQQCHGTSTSQSQASV